MPTIAFIMQTFYGDQIGGAERQVQMLAAALREQGWKTAYLSERPVGKPARENFQGMEVWALPPRKKRWAFLNSEALTAAARESSADIIYQRVRHPYTGLARHTAAELKKPFVWAAASTADVIRRQDLRAASGQQPPLDRLMHSWLRRAEDRGILQAEAIILQTEEQRRLLLENYGRKGTVIPNHIAVSARTDLPRQEPPEVLWVSNIKSFKRPELFLDLARRCADLKADFVMVGACPSLEIREAISQGQKSLGNFTWVGPLEPSQAEARIAAATVLVNTSSFEGFPNAFQQAWCHGVPTLSLEADPDGVIVRERLGNRSVTMERLEADLRQILGDVRYRHEIADRARSFARRNYDLANLLPVYISLFESLIGA
jgi:glycosyltransferase involved in cell wall biosynthesis